MLTQFVLSYSNTFDQLLFAYQSNKSHSHKSLLLIRRRRRRRCAIRAHPEVKDDGVQIQSDHHNADCAHRHHHQLSHANGTTSCHRIPVDRNTVIRVIETSCLLGGETPALSCNTKTNLNYDWCGMETRCSIPSCSTGHYYDSNRVALPSYLASQSGTACSNGSSTGLVAGVTRAVENDFEGAHTPSTLQEI